MKKLKIITVLIFALLAIFLQQTGILAAEKIDINTAPLEDLIKIIHIGPARATELISLRPFSSLDDLVKIKGIGEKRLEDIKKQGLAWVNPEAEPVPGIEPELQSEQEPQPEQKPQPRPKPQPVVYPSNVLINEILPSPEGPDAEEEWIEIFNQNNFKVDLSGWQITDSIGRTKTYTFPEGTIIGPQEFLVFSRPTTKITLNNDGDEIKLLQPDGKIIDTVSYEKAPRGQSYNRTDSKWIWSATLTPKSVNIIPAPISKTKEVESLKEAEEIAKGQPERKLAAISEQIPKEGLSSLFILLIALAIAIFSGMIILILKKQIEKVKIN